eukprot:SAG31_NODE_4264_length_3397_cov_2.164948_4_plen_194_part_00
MESPRQPSGGAGGAGVRERRWQCPQVIAQFASIIARHSSRYVRSLYSGQSSQGSPCLLLQRVRISSQVATPCIPPAVARHTVLFQSDPGPKSTQAAGEAKHGEQTICVNLHGRQNGRRATGRLTVWRDGRERGSVIENRAVWNGQIIAGETLRHRSGMNTFIASSTRCSHCSCGCVATCFRVVRTVADTGIVF